jgi:hypothetical protein
MTIKNSPMDSVERSNERLRLNAFRVLYAAQPPSRSRERQVLGHGQFLRLFASHRDPLPEPVRCHKRTAQKYISIATNVALSEAASMPLLPVDFVILYELSRIDKEGRDRLLAYFHLAQVAPIEGPPA